MSGSWPDTKIHVSTTYLCLDCMSKSSRLYTCVQLSLWAPFLVSSDIVFLFHVFERCQIEWSYYVDDCCPPYFYIQHQMYQYSELEGVKEGSNFPTMDQCKLRIGRPSKFLLSYDSYSFLHYEIGRTKLRTNFVPAPLRCFRAKTVAVDLVWIVLV